MDYAYEVNWFDKHVGEMVEILEENGELDNTLIVITSDNGMPFPRVKGHMYDMDFRLPFVAYHNGLIEPGTQIDELYSFMDLAPTFLNVAGIESDDSMSGNSFAAVLEGKK